MSAFYWDMTNNKPVQQVDQTQHFAFYFAVGCEFPSWVPAPAVYASMIGQNKFPNNNPGDCLLACRAASLGSMYKANPKLDFQVALDVLRNTGKGHHRQRPDHSGHILEQFYQSTLFNS